MIILKTRRIANVNGGRDRGIVMKNASTETIRTHNLGYPRIGGQRELKKATEAYWKGGISREELLAVGRRLREANWRKQQEAGIDLVPVNDFSYYDQTLDMSCLLGNVPPRFRWQGGQTDVDTVFTVARGTRSGRYRGGATPVEGSSEDGKDCQTGKVSTFASEMTKRFDTNYQYIVPEVAEMTRLMEKAEAVIPQRNLWVNPDCGLKTRGWAEVKPSLENLVATAKTLRASQPVEA